MRRDPPRERPPTLRPAADPDLTAHALGRLAPAERERVERALSADPALRARHAAIVRHLARYDALRAPPPPPFADLALRLPARRTTGGMPGRLAWAGAAALVLLLLGGLWLRGRDAGIPARVGEGVRVTGDGAWVAADEPAEAWLGERVHVVLDAGAVLRPLAAERVRLEAGRAWFEVQPGPFAVETARGDVRVRGTTFEVAVEAHALYVAVAEGAVEAAGRIVASGAALVDGRITPVARTPGAFFRRPVLTLAVERAPEADEPATLRFTFANPGRVPFTVAGPDGIRAALWLELVGPGGAVHDVPVPGVDAEDGPLPAKRPLQLAGRGERSFTARVGLPARDRGPYRCRALYRPEGQPSLVSDTVLLEVR